MINFIIENLLSILLVVVGLSAFGVYFWQKHDDLRTAATLLRSQIISIEKSITLLKEDRNIGNPAVYFARKILHENLWEKYRHLFVKKLSVSEADIVQRFFDNAEQIERARLDILSTMTTSWVHQSLIQHEYALNKLIDSTDGIDKETIKRFGRKTEGLSLAYTPDMAIDLLMNALDNFILLSGTTAYQKIQKYSFDK